MSYPQVDAWHLVRRQLGTVIDFQPRIGIGTIAIDQGPMVKVRQTEIRPRTALRWGEDLAHAHSLVPGQRVSCELDRELDDSPAAWSVVVLSEDDQLEDQ